MSDMIKIKFYSPDNLEYPKPTVLTASVNKSGRMMLGVVFCRYYKITENKSISFGRNAESDTDDCIYGLINDTLTENGFGFKKRGRGMFFLMTEGLFIHLGVDFSESIQYNIDEIKNEGGVLLKFTRVNTED